MKQAKEYREGHEAGESFRELATALFRAPKDGRVKKKGQKPKKATARKTHGKNDG